MIRVVHPTGNTFVRALLDALQLAGRDYEFWTTIAFDAKGVSGWLPRRIQEQLQRRSYELPSSRVKTRPWRESVRLLVPLLGMQRISRHEYGWASVDAVFRDLDRAVASHLRNHTRVPCREDWLYAYEDGALEAFQAAEKTGVRRAYELPIAYWETSRRLLKEEAERWPDWAATLVGPEDSTAKLERKTRELALAEVVVVPSRFVERSLPGWLKPEQRVVVAEFGSPEVRAGQRLDFAAQGAGGSGPLRLLFAGSMSQRKGLADVFEAMRLLRRSDVELIVMGSAVVPMDFYRSQGVQFKYEPPRPHTGVLELMRSCHALVLPSIVEGRALVQQEAMACGLPILVTANAGGEDLVVEGETGFLIPIRSPHALAGRMDWLASNRSMLPEMGVAAKTRAARLTWSRYGGIILDALHHELLAPQLTPLPLAS